MNAATKNILRSVLNVYNSGEDQKTSLPGFIQKRVNELKDTNWVNVRNSADANHCQAYSIFLRILKPNTEMKKDKIKEVDHSQRAHALLSASGASRWLACTPSPRLEEGFENKSSSFAEEGTLAHEFAEINLKRVLSLISRKEWLNLTGTLFENSFYSKDMQDHVQKHVDYVIQQFTEAKRLTPDAVLLIEQKVDITHLIEEGFGTCDVIIIADGTLEVIDLKYGMGLRVSAENNSQLKLYGSGALEAYDMLYDIHTVRLTVTQPRLDSISSWDISAEDLRQWGEEVVKPKALEAYAGKGEQVTGDHCQFCKASARCKAQADLAAETAKADFADAKLLTDEELVEIYKNIPNVSKWFKTIEQYMYDEAMAGKSWPEHKLVDGQSRRGWTDEDRALELLGDYKQKDVLNIKLKGIGDIEKLVGKKEFPTLLGEVVAFKKTAPSLVHESDKRPAMGNEEAKSDFAEDL
jgi:hypothetical protein